MQKPLNDIRNDIAELKQGIIETKFTISSIDSVLSIGMSMNSNKDVPGKFYYYSKFTTDFYRIDWNKSTMDQMIQSGNLRYFTDKNLVQKINQYYAFENALFQATRSDASHRINSWKPLTVLFKAVIYIICRYKTPDGNNIPSANRQLDS
ncbi:MAG: hypothetical protein IPI68_08335 [Chitinophagaceae bacterium]|nr:hypothetical protein [Chitinophagaceae bacterium]